MNKRRYHNDNKSTHRYNIHGRSIEGGITRDL